MQTIKCVVVGDGAVGKVRLVLVLVAQDSLVADVEHAARSHDAFNHRHRRVC